MAYSRNEYLQSLNRMRANYQNQGNPLINKEDDNGNVGTELSSFAYMETNKQAPEQASKGKKDNFNLMSSIRGIGNSIDKGFFNFLDTIGDFVITTAGAISGVVGGIGSAISGNGWEQGWEQGTDWAKNAVKYDWEQQATNFFDLTAGWFGNLLSGEMSDGWSDDWASLSSPEASKERLARIGKTGKVDKAQPWAEVGGEILPAVALAVLTYGASSAGSISSLSATLINAGVAGVTATGSSMEKAVKETDKFGGKELGYAYAKGAVAGGLSFALSAVGGQLGQNGGVIEKGASKFSTMFSNATARTIAKDVADITARVGLQVSRTGVDQLLDPVLQAIYSDKQTIAERYGEEYWENFGKTLATTAVIATIASIAGEASKIKQAGGWKDYVKANDYRLLAQGAQKYDALRLKMYQELDNAKTPYDAGRIMARYKLQMDKLSKSLTKIMETANAEYRANIARGDNFVMKSEHTTGDFKQMLDQKSINADMYKTYSALRNTKFKAQFDKMEQYLKNGNAGFKSSDGSFVNIDPEGNATAGVSKGGNTYALQITASNGNLKYEIGGKQDVINAVQVLSATKNVSLPTMVSDIKPNTLNIPRVQATGLNTSQTLTLTKEVATKIMNRANAGSIKYFLDKGIKGSDKNNYVMKPGDNKYIVVEPYEENGIQKYGMIVVDSKTNEITDITVSNNAPSSTRYTIEPKEEVEMIAKTKLENSDGSAIRYAFADVPNELNGWALTPITSTSETPVFVYAKNPLREVELKSKLSFGKMVKKFNISSSLEKTYSKKLADKNPLSVIEFISRYAKTDAKGVLAKLGYDAFEYKDGTVIVNKGAQIIRGDLKYGENKGTYDYRSLVKRFGRESADKELRGYLGEDGRKLETPQDRQEYARLIKENHAYKVEDFRRDTLYVTDEKVYTTELKEIADGNAKLGATTKFITIENPSRDLKLASGWYDNNNNIYLRLDNNDPRTLTVRNLHERYHFLSDKFYVRAISNFDKLFNQWKTNYPQEYGGLFERYLIAYTDLYFADISIEDMIDEEIIAEIYCGDIKLQDTELQQRMIDTVNKVAKLGEEKALQKFYESDKETFKPISVKYSIDNSKEIETTKIISDLKAKSSAVLIEAGADVSKSAKYRLESVKSAFDNALKEVAPDNGTFKLNFADTKQSFAELNLARPKDRGIAIDNLMKRLKNTEITLVTTLGEDKVKLGELLTMKQEQQARDIMLDTLNGKAEPTKLANWIKSLSLAKLETLAVKDHIKLLNRFERRIDASSHLNFGYGNAPVPELTVFKNILNNVPRFWDNKGVLAFADSVLANYNDSNIKPLLDQCGVLYDENIRAVAQNLKTLVVPGKHLDPRVQRLADSVLRLLYNNLENVDTAVKSKNVKLAEYDANVTQSMGNGRKHDGKITGAVKKIISGVDNAVTSVNDFLKRRVPGTNLQKFVEEETGVFENKEIELKEKYENLLFRELPTKEVKSLINKKFTFKGEKISYGVALDRLNSYKTLGDKFFNSKGTITNPDSTRGEVVYSQEDIADLEQAIPQELLDYNEKVLKVLNKDLKADIKELYKTATHTDLVTLDEDSVWYNISRVSDNFFGVNLGGVSMRDFNLSMFNQRVNSRADINFNLDLQTHIRNYLNKAFKVLVWTPYINKLNTLLNTRVYGVTNYKIYQQNIIGFDKQVDMLVHQVLGVPFETKVSTLSNVASKIVGNLNAVRVATIQAGWRTVSSAPMFAKYFGAKIALQGQLQNLKNGDLFAIKKNYEVIKQYSPYLSKRFTSVEVALAETGVKVANTLMKIVGTPLRFGDASIHLTLGFAMAQVQAQKDGYGAPYTDANNKRASYLLEQASKSTQPTNAIGRVAGFRYGNSVSKYLFGLYGSMKQVFYDALVAPIEDIVTTKPRIEAMENAIKEHEAKIKEYGDLADEALERMENASTDEEYNEAEKDYEKYKFKQESHEKAKNNTEENLNNFKKAHTSKALFNRLSGALGGFMFASLMYVAIRHAISVLEGKKRVQDFTIKDFTVDVAEQAFMNSLPYLSTLYASVKNNSDLSIATLDNLNNTIDAVKKLVEAIESQNGGYITGATWNFLKEVSQYFGVPLSAMVRLVNGAWYNVDKESNVDFHNWLGMLSASKLRSNYSTAVKNGDKQTAIANLEVWTANHSIKTSQNVLEEIYRLGKAGETGVAPSAIPTKYTNEKGDEIKLTKAQINAFRREYSKADKVVSKLLTVDGYKKQDNSTKASLIKRAYSAYRESAQAKALGIAPTSKLGKLIYYTNGDIELAKYIMSLQNLSAITDDKKHTRKENVISAINKMAGFSRQEKLLLAYLGGYNVSEKNQKALINFLVSKGFDKDGAKNFLNIK